MHTLIHAWDAIYSSWRQLHWYGVAVGSLLGIKLLLSIRRRRSPGLTFRKTTHRLSIHGVVTVYNESPRC